MDGEGDGGGLLEGAADLLACSSPRVVIDLHSPAESKEVVEKLAKAGYAGFTESGNSRDLSSYTTAVVCNRPTPPRN